MTNGNSVDQNDKEIFSRSNSDTNGDDMHKVDVLKSDTTAG